MKAFKLVKKFKHLDNSEERDIAHALNDGAAALEVVADYLQIKVLECESPLNNLEALYTQTGDNNMRVATLLAKREVYLKLMNLLNIKVELDVDQTKD